MPEPADISTLLGISRALHANTEKLNGNKRDSVPDPVVKMPMTRDEYVKKQNKIFQQLKKPPSIGFENNEDLAEMLELYMASMDEQIYNEVELQRRVLLKADQISKSHLEILLEFADETDKYTYIIDKISQLQTLVSVLEANYTDMCNQRNQLEETRLDLKHKYAIELGKRTRLSHMVKVMSQKVISLDKQLTQEQAARQQEQQQAKTTIRDKEAKVASLETQPQPKEVEEYSELSLDDKLTTLFTEVLKLQNLEKETPSDPERMLTQTLAHLDNAKSKKSQQAKELVRGLIDQYDAKEKQLLVENQRLTAEKDIFVARCERLETKISEKADEIQGLIDRSISLILTDKQLRSQLVSQNDILRRYEQIIETSRTHIEQLTAENEVLILENDDLIGKS